MQDTIKAQLKAAMMAKETTKVMTLRGVTAAFTNDLVARGITPTDPMTDEDCIRVIKKLIKQRKDSIEQFIAGGREDLADDEKAELAVLETLIPAQMTREEIVTFVQNKITEMGEIDKTKIGQITGSIIKAIGSNADGAMVKSVIDEILK